jgi:hypothetical protein
MTNTPFWATDPTILFNSEHISQIYPRDKMSVEEKINAISRLIIILTFLGYLLTQTIKIVVTGVITLGVLVLLYNVRNRSKFDNSKIVENFSSVNPKYYDLMKPNFTSPTVNNPAMNVLLTEIADNPNRNQAAPSFNKEVEQIMNEKTQQFVSSEFKDPNIDQRLFRDLGDAFEFDQSMRTFYATPNTKIPNDQTSFADFLYGDMISCKDGNALACTRDNPRYNLY